MGSSRPGKFPAKITSVKHGKVTMEGAEEDVEYLKPSIGKMMTVEITPTSSASPEPPVGGDQNEESAS